jgi:hypothetical protein
MTRPLTPVVPTTPVTPEHSPWLESALAITINEMNLEYAKGQLADLTNDPDVLEMKARELLMGRKTGSVLVSINPTFRSLSGENYGLAFPFTVRDLETDEQYELELAVDLFNGHAWVHNGYNRVSPLYNLRLEDPTCPLHTHGS